MFELNEEEIKNYVPEKLSKLIDKRELAIIATIRAMKQYPGYGEITIQIQRGLIHSIKPQVNLIFEKDWSDKKYE